MNSDFSVKCPYCGKENDFSGDNWNDELVDDSGDANVDCLHCKKELLIRTHAIYTLEIVNEDLEGIISDADYIDFFDWLRVNDKIDLYEALLDTSIECQGDQPLRLQANDDIDQLKKDYELYLEGLI